MTTPRLCIEGAEGAKQMIKRLTLAIAIAIAIFLAESLITTIVFITILFIFVVALTYLALQ
jgi:hypothetical protein